MRLPGDARLPCHRTTDRHRSHDGRLVMVKPGRYRHYKGQEYEVIGCARHSETEEQLVVYRALYGDRGLWVRPVAMFVEQVQLDGMSVPRFSFLQEANQDEH